MHAFSSCVRISASFHELRMKFLAGIINNAVFGIISQYLLNIRTWGCVIDHIVDLRT